jgi:hypothetical protein
MPRGRARQLQRHFLLSLIHQTEVLQEPRWLGILHRLDLCLCILDGPGLYPRILLAPHLCSGIMLGPDLCPRIVYRLDVPVLLHGPDLCSGILHDVCLVILDLGLGILYGLHGPDLCLCIFLCRPSLELLEQGFRWWLPDFGLTLISSFKSGSSVVARRRILCCRRQSLSVGG